jgi:hypothetical protein
MRALETDERVVGLLERGSVWLWYAGFAAAMLATAKENQDVGEMGRKRRMMSKNKNTKESGFSSIAHNFIPFLSSSLRAH